MIFRRRRSGEIVNATLMEVFIVLCFMFIIYASMVEDEANAKTAVANARLENTRRELTLSKENLGQVRAEALGEKLRADDLEQKWNAIFPPYCPGFDQGESYGTMVLLPGDRIRVHVPTAFRSEADFQGSREMSGGEFQSSFLSLRAHTRELSCRLPVRVVDESLSLADHKATLRRVRDVFYTRGELE